MNDELPLIKVMPQQLETDSVIYHNNVPMDKGFMLNEDYLMSIRPYLESTFQIYSVYPDIYLDVISGSTTKFKLFPYQRLYLRAIMRYKQVYVTAPRGWSKSFVTILGMMLQCIFIPGHKCFLTANSKLQASSIAKSKLFEIFDNWPLLKNEFEWGRNEDYPGTYGKDYCELKGKNGSVFSIVLAGDSTRGQRFHSGLIDEVRDADGDMLNSVILPLLNVSRRMPDGTINPKEPNQQALYATSAGAKQSYAYELLMDVFQNAIINPDRAFCFGNDYRIPLFHGLLDKQFLNSLKMSTSFNENAYATEYLSTWISVNADSWYNFDRISAHRTIHNPHLMAKAFNNAEGYYLLSWDISRFNDLSVVTVFRVLVSPSTGVHQAKVVNIRLLGLKPEQKTMQRQIVAVKQMIEDYNPRELVMDTNGIGAGWLDAMIQPTFDVATGKQYPAYGVNNDSRYYTLQPADAPRIIYSLKANSSLKPEIEANAFNRINAGSVDFLIKEQDARNRLLSTKKGQKMSIENRTLRLMPHEMTSRLFDEIMNFRLKGNVGGKITLEPINKNMHDDRYMSLAYGLWRIKEFEEFTMQKRRVSRFSQLVFFN